MIGRCRHGSTALHANRPNEKAGLQMETVVKRIPDSDAAGELDPRVYEVLSRAKRDSVEFKVYVGSNSKDVQVSKFELV